MKNESRTKMVCVIRRDLRNTDNQKLPKGKLVAQGGHAYVALVLQILRKKPYSGMDMLNKWLSESFVKICLGVDSLEEMMDIYEKAKKDGLNVVLIEDNGHTQFGGSKTPTCIGIGPAYNEEINKYTGHLKSL